MVISSFIRNFATLKNETMIYELRKYPTLVIHVERFTERAASIERQMKAAGMYFTYILKGDVEEIDDAVLLRYFKDGRDNMYRATPITSCALKHLYAYEHILDNDLPGALILEDDAILDKGFIRKFDQSLKEYEDRWASEPVIISYENSALVFVPRSQRKAGQMLYPGDKDRYAGAYFINRKAAEAILNDVKENRCELAIDGYHNYLLHKGVIKYLWCHPTIVQQGTVIGQFSSSLSADDLLQKLRWKLKLGYKQLLYYFR